MKKFLEIPLSIYRILVLISWETTKEEIIKFARNHKVIITEEQWGKDFFQHYQNKRCNGLCMELGDDNCDILVWIRKIPTSSSEYGVLYHELYHAVYHIIEQRNLYNEIESPAFIYEYLANECNKYFWNLAIKKRK